MYNDGKGMLFGLEFQPILSPPKEGEKRRKNAKAPKINTSFYIHEDSGLASMIILASRALKRPDLAFTIDDAGEIIQSSVDIKYTIARTQWKGVGIQNRDDYERLLEEATKKKNAEVKIMMTEVPVRGL